MKTLVELDDHKVKKAKICMGSSSLGELLDKALDALIDQSSRHSMESLIGPDFFDGDLDKMRGRHDCAG